MKPDNPWLENIGVIAHDLNGPITAVKGNIELIQLTGPLNEKQQRFAERALVSLTQMEQLVKMLLDVAWLDADKPLEPHDVEVGKMVSMAVSLLDSTATRRKITLETEVDPDTGSVKGDLQRLPQVINNLINNAIKYNHEGGTVWVTTRGDADHVEIIVRDNGRGIPEEDLPYLFEQFFRVKPNASGTVDGTGLGLAIVKAVVDKHNGKVIVTSAPGEGTTFTVTLPRQQPAGTPPVATE